MNKKTGKQKDPDKDPINFLNTVSLTEKLFKKPEKLELLKDAQKPNLLKIPPILFEKLKDEDIKRLKISGFLISVNLNLINSFHKVNINMLKQIAYYATLYGVDFLNLCIPKKDYTFSQITLKSIEEAQRRDKKLSKPKIIIYLLAKDILPIGKKKESETFMSFVTKTNPKLSEEAKNNLIEATRLIYLKNSFDGFMGSKDIIQTINERNHWKDKIPLYVG